MPWTERIVLCWLLGGGMTAASAAQSFSCPAQMAAPPAVAASHAGWTAWASPRPAHFDQIMITSGHPDEEATLVPGIDTKKWVGWRLQPDREHWVVCRYDDSNQRLIQRLPAGVRQCVVALKTVGRGVVQQATELKCE